jgi:hypothetical protein
MVALQGDRTARELSEQIRRDVQAQVEAQVEAQAEARAEAIAARAEARQAAAEARAAMQGEGTAPPPPAIPRIRVTRDGHSIVVDEEPQLVTSTQGPGPDPFPIIPVEMVVITIAFFVMLAVIAIGVPLARAFARRMDRRSAEPAIPRELAEQLLRLEQSVDTIAVEVERISEGQRFSSALMRDLHPLVQRSQIAAPVESPGANGGR